MLRRVSNSARIGAIVCLLTLAGCSSDGEASTTETTAAPSDGGNPQTGVTQPLLPSLPKDQTLDLQVNHANGSVARLLAASFKEDHIELSLDITNGAERQISLNGLEDAVVRDNQGAVYRLSPPPSNARLTIPGRSTQKYQLVFLGRIHPAATSINLFLNDRYGSSDNQYSTTPTFRLGPVPVTR